MFEGTVLGVDPGTASVGLAVVANGRRPEIVWSGTVRTPAGMATADRLRRIHEAVTEVIVRERPVAMAVERLMWGQNKDSAMEVSRAAGVIMLAGAQAGLRVEEYAPLEVKMAVTGVGNAPKDAVRRGLGRILGIEAVPKEPDAADAVAVAMCHLQQSKLRRMISSSVGAR